MEYASIADQKSEIVSKMEEVEHLDFGKNSKIVQMEEFQNRVKECKDYLARCKLDFDGDV